MTPEIYVRAFELEDYKLINAWRRDDETYRLATGDKFFVSSDRDRKWVEEKVYDNQRQVYLAICLKKSDVMIGYIAFSGIDHRNGCAEFSGIVIGDKDQRGHGYAKQATLLLLEYAFHELRLQTVWGAWLDDNQVSQSIFRKMGFQQEGILRRRVYKGGRHHDLVVMSMLKEEFEALRQSNVPEPRKPGSLT